jgi:hypothetical protein
VIKALWSSSLTERAATDTENCPKYAAHQKGNKQEKQKMKIFRAQRYENCVLKSPSEELLVGKT